MIFFAKDKVENVRQKAQGGEGEVRGRHPFSADKRPERTAFKMIGEMTLPVGSSVGFHVHQEDEEIYIINQGQGRYTRNDGQTAEVGPGDVTMTRKGEGHGLANIGQEPLVFTAVIAG
ncbi:MAG: cupin domain-containing protein [Candidatus Adiutrix sp.]|jgi:mannose-6-phosphate isomerase-like protein (cupin superfamily)|nr:cupin domain-containing protein [Candidatus Adiutrix sp.]